MKAGMVGDASSPVRATGLQPVMTEGEREVRGEVMSRMLLAD